ncbi:SGNH hydrolase-type esterase domain-containing protein [Aspergillus pseudotamarii]|uniref:SGNH hydrolase-type esterase domain-containing protein n=1 Tax=Aspergillus pseudotamarii TaxID=132259 RepID=A0A5N6SRQ0_ASPPS|nr:SGNH hydrolase-type esterase domain-containing protein [Aspergillus pseudotamarii]KAE8137366.1 SGNH hydrolase-type esterase domain-containing protein [Aspergillus pseudotamarii]
MVIPLGRLSALRRFSSLYFYLAITCLLVMLAMMAAMGDTVEEEPGSGMTAHGLLEPKLKVMIVGDSMSQGREGDWTWRFRIWEWFKDQGLTVDFVGPYNGTAQSDLPSLPATPSGNEESQWESEIRTSGGYAAGVSQDFDKNHFAIWGRAVAIDKGLIYDVLAAYPADLILLMLGFNDMAWFHSDAAGTVDSMQTFILNARAANPRLKFAIANVPQRTFISGREDLPVSTNIYNALLREAIPRWSTLDSPVQLVELHENYDCAPIACPVGYDGLHPNAQGEYQIARAFTLTLVKDFDIGASPLSVPTVSGGPLSISSKFQDVGSLPQGVPDMII